MKKRILYIAIMSAMICATMLSGCNNTEDTATGAKPTETSSSVTTTVTTSTQAQEVTTEPTTAAETTTETETVTEPHTAPPKQEESKVETEKPQTNKPSGNFSNSGNTITTQKPAQNTNNNTSSDNKPNNNTSQTITDDTKLTHKQFSTSANMQRVVSSLNSYYAGKGMILNTSLTTDNSGWMFAYQGELNTSAVRSYNEQYNRIVTGLDEQIDAFLEMSEATYSDLTFNCYAEMQSNGEYHIYFCHE